MADADEHIEVVRQHFSYVGKRSWHIWKARQCGLIVAVFWIWNVRFPATFLMYLPDQPAHSRCIQGRYIFSRFQYHAVSDRERTTLPRLQRRPVLVWD